MKLTSKLNLLQLCLVTQLYEALAGDEIQDAFRGIEIPQQVVHPQGRSDGDADQEEEEEADEEDDEGE